MTEETEAEVGAEQTLAKVQSDPAPDAEPEATETVTQEAPRSPQTEQGPTNADRREYDPFAPHDEAVTQEAPRAPTIEKGPTEDTKPDTAPETGGPNNEWTAQGTLNVDGVWHKLWTTAEGKVAVLIGDAETGEHLIANDAEQLAAEIRAILAQHAS